MPAAIIIDLADQIVEAINAEFGYADFTAARQYVPVHELAELVEPKVTVVPAETSDAPQTRNSDAFELAVDVAYQERVEDVDNATLDARMLVVDQIGDVFRGGRVTLEAGEATCVSVSNRPIFDPAHIDQHRVFTSVIRLTFRVSRVRP